MKKYLLILILLASASIGKLSAQQLNYQGIARNANGVAMAFQEISLRLTIRDGSSTGISVYSETRLVRTNQFGLFTIVIGSPGASNISGSFVTINWITGNKYLQVEIDPAGGSAFQLAGVSQLQSVPYAYFAAAAYPVGLAGGDLRGSTYPDPIIAPKVVTNGKLADTSVSTIKIIDRNVTNIKIANPYIYFNDLPVQLGQGQYFIIDSLGSNFNILSYDSIHKFNIPSASATKRGLLKSNDWTYFNNKLNLSDTAAMLLGYTRVNRFNDTATALQTRIQNKVNYSDTAVMLSARPLNNRFLDTATALQSRIQNKVNYSDTAAMLSARPLNNRFLDTATALQSRIQNKVNYSDTAAMLSARPLNNRFLDTSRALQIRIQTKLTKLDADTYYPTITRLTDTTSAIQSRIQTKEPLLGFTPINKADSLSGGYTTWDRTKKVIDSSGTLKWSTTGNAGLIAGTTYFLGTLDDQPLRFRVGLTNTWAGELNPTSSNTSFGFGAAQSTAINKNNTAMGVGALSATTTGGDNTAVGQGSLSSNIIGNNNTAIGQGSLFTNTGTSNTGVGHATLNKNTNAINNTAVGKSALELNTSGSNNTAIGHNSLTANLVGSRNAALGQNSLSTTTGSDNIGIGYNSLVSAGISNSIAIGSGSSVSVDGSVAIGTNATNAVTNSIVLGSVANTLVTVNGELTTSKRITGTGARFNYTTTAITTSLTIDNYYLKILSNVPVTLPDATLMQGQKFVIFNGTVGVYANTNFLFTPGQSIIGNGWPADIVNNGSISLFSDGFNWLIESKN